MLEKLTNRHKVGVTRAIKGMPSVQEQVDTLTEAGVAERYIWQLDKDEPNDIIIACRPGDDVLVVPFLGVLGRYRFEILKGIAEKGATLYDLDQYGELEISQAATFDLINKACTTAQSAPGRKEAEGKGGRNKKFSKAQEMLIRADYEGTDLKTVRAVCDKWGVSTTWLFNRWGGRDDARRKAAKRKSKK